MVSLAGEGILFIYSTHFLGFTFTLIGENDKRQDKIKRIKDIDHTLTLRKKLFQTFVETTHS